MPLVTLLGGWWASGGSGTPGAPTPSQGGAAGAPDSVTPQWMGESLHGKDLGSHLFTTPPSPDRHTLPAPSYSPSPLSPPSPPPMASLSFLSLPFLPSPASPPHFPPLVSPSRPSSSPSSFPSPLPPTPSPRDRWVWVCSWAAVGVLGHPQPPPGADDAHASVCPPHPVGVPCGPCGAVTKSRLGGGLCVVEAPCVGSWRFATVGGASTHHQTPGVGGA